MLSRLPRRPMGTSRSHPFQALLLLLRPLSGDEDPNSGKVAVTPSPDLGGVARCVGDTEIGSSVLRRLELGCWQGLSLLPSFGSRAAPRKGRACAREAKKHHTDYRVSGVKPIRSSEYDLNSAVETL